jgi:Flp pilus assembly protein TadD
MRGIGVLLLAIVTVTTPAFSQRGTPKTMPNPEIHGQVRFPAGYSAGVGLRVQLDGISTGLHTETMTDSSGKFLFRGLSPDTYTIRVSGPGLESQAETIRMEDIRVGFVTMDLRRTKSPEPAVSPGGPISAADASIPEDARLEFEKGEALLITKKDPKGSLDHFRKAAKVYPRYARAHLMMGLANMELSDWESARTELEKTVELDAKLADARLALGSTLNAESKFVEAEKNLRIGLQLAPNSAMGHYELGRACWALGRVRDAQAEAEQAVKLQPDLSEAHILIGNAMIRNGDTNGAIREYAEYLRLDPSGRFADATRAMLKKLEKAHAE